MKFFRIKKGILVYQLNEQDWESILVSGDAQYEHDIDKWVFTMNAEFPPQAIEIPKEVTPPTP